MNKNLIFSFRNKKIKSKEKYLIAGEWVTENIDENILKELDYEIFQTDSHLKNRIINSFNSNIIYEKIIKDLSLNLNNIHSVKFSVKSWKIIFGNWLKRFVDICFEKNYLLFEILEKKINEIYGIKSNCPRHSDRPLEIFFQAGDEYWNNNLVCDLLDYYDLGVNHFFFECDFKKKINNIVQNQKRLLKNHSSFLKLKMML